MHIGYSAVKNESLADLALSPNIEFVGLRALPAAADVQWPWQNWSDGDWRTRYAYLLAARGLFGQPLTTGVHPSGAS
ncbi:MAG: hypothetical protein EOM91_17115 [Sphingobacteriia bacterium]|nr:hypothetical protein [Sphingobacteriia bacterium]